MRSVDKFPDMKLHYQGRPVKPSISKITGGNLAARDKRNILDCIEYLRGQDHHNAWQGYKRSPKRYCVTPDSAKPIIYDVRILETTRPIGARNGSVSGNSRLRQRASAPCNPRHQEPTPKPIYLKA